MKALKIIGIIMTFLGFAQITQNPVVAFITLAMGIGCLMLVRISKNQARDEQIKRAKEKDLEEARRQLDEELMDDLRFWRTQRGLDPDDDSEDEYYDGIL